MEETTFQRKVRERREAAERAAREAKEAHPSFDKDLIPSEQHQRSDEDKEMDRIIKSIDILDAYAKWCGKMRPKVSQGQTENIMVSCPVPGHADKNPSAAVNTDKQVWSCYKCNKGGDTMDLAALHFGIKNYKDGANFHELRRRMAQAYGYTFTRLPGNVTQIQAPSSEPEPEPEVEPEASAEVIDLYDESEEQFEIELDWRVIVPENTFLDTYMKVTTIDDVPEEYHFWNGLLAIGLAIGRDVRLADTVPVFGNLFVCTLGRSGSGKSKSKRYLDQLLNAALPFNETNPRGVKRVSSPGSGEALIRSFMNPIADPANPKKIVGYEPVRGYIDFSELSGIMARTNRQGSSMQQHLFQFADTDPYIESSAESMGNRRAEYSFACASTTTQPRALRTLLRGQDAASGFLNRWVFVPGKEKPRIPVGGKVIDVTPAVRPLQEINGWARSFMGQELMEWTPEALSEFSKWCTDVIYPDQIRGQADVLSRTDLMMKKIVLLLTANRKLKKVPIEVVTEAKIVYNYLLQAYGIPANQVDMTYVEEIKQKVLNTAQKFTEKHKRGITLSELSRSLKNSKYPDKMIEEALKYHVMFQRLEVATTPPGSVGRPTVRYKYVG